MESSSSIHSNQPSASLSNWMAGHPIRDGDYWVGNTCGEKVNHFLKTRFAHKIMLFLILIDLILVISGTFFELYHLETEVEAMRDQLKEYHEHGCVAEVEQESEVCELKEEYGDVWLKDAEKICGILSFLILNIFLFENLVVLFSEGCSYFTDYKENSAHWFDLAIVLVSYLFEAVVIFGLSEGRDPYRFLTIGRLWRLGRIGEGVFEATEHTERIRNSIQIEMTNSIKRQAEENSNAEVIAKSIKQDSINEKTNIDRLKSIPLS